MANREQKGNKEKKKPKQDKSKPKIGGTPAPFANTGKSQPLPKKK
jgi:hypothetical protein